MTVSSSLCRPVSGRSVVAYASELSISLPPFVGGQFPGRRDSVLTSMQLLVPVAVAVVLGLIYSRIWIPGEDDETATEQQRAAEQGTFGDHATNHPGQEHPGTTSSSPPAPASTEPPSNSLGRKILTVLDHIPRFLFKYAILILWRSVLACQSLWGYTFNWIEWQVTKNYPPRILMVAFGMMNFTTLAVYYLVVFDPKGTVAPKWSDILG
jgi:hypothetical protein